MRALAAIAVLALATPAAAVELPVKVEDGATWTLQSLRMREESRNGTTRRVETRNRYQVTYHSGAQRWLSLRLVDGELDGDLPKALDPAKKSISVEVEVDESLLPERLRNWPQVREMLYALYLDDQDQKVVDVMRANFDAMPDTQAAALFLPQLAFLGLGQGQSLESGKPHHYQDLLPNPLGGPSVATDSAFALESDGDHEAVVVWTQSLDRDSPAASLKVALTNLAARVEAPNREKLDETLRTTTLDRQDRCRFRIDKASGLARQADCTSTMKIEAAGQSGGRTDTWTITQSPPEHR